MIINREEELKGSLARTQRAVEVDSSYWKTFTVGAIAGFLALAFSYFFWQFLSKTVTSQGGITFFLFLLFSLVFIFQVILIRELRFLVALVWLQSLLLWVSFVGKGTFLALSVGFVTTGLFLMWAVYEGHREANESMKIRFFRIGRVTITKFMAAMALLAVIAYLGIAARGSVNLASKEILTDFLSRSSYWVSKFYPGFSFDNSFNSNVELIVRQQLDSNPALSSLSVDQKEVIVARGINQYEDYVGNIFGAPVDLRASLSDVLYALVEVKADQLLTLYGSVVYFIMVIVVALLLRGLSPIIYWPLLLFGFLIYQLLLAFGFATVLLESRSKEVIVLK